MTLPDERTYAVTNTRQFLLDLACGKIKRIPSEVRQMARSLLRHYPGHFDMHRTAEKAPDVFGPVEERDNFSF